MRPNEKGLFIYNAHPLVNTSPYSGILTPTFVFLIRYYLLHSPATAGSFKVPTCTVDDSRDGYCGKKTELSPIP